MKKFLFLCMIVVLPFFLSACGQMVTIDKQVKYIKDNVEDGFAVKDIQKAYLTNDEFPELVVLLDTNEHSIVKVYQYHKDSELWSVIYEDTSHLNYGGLESLNILDIATYNDTKQEHIFIGYHGGSGGFLNFYVIGLNEKNEIGEVFNKMFNEFPNSYIEKTKEGFDLYSGDETVEQYNWNGDSYFLTTAKNI